MRRLIAFVLSAAPILAGSSQEEPCGSTKGGISIARSDGRRVSGRITGSAESGFQFTPDGRGPALALEEAGRVMFEGPGPSPATAAPPFQVRLGIGGRISGRLGALTAEALRLDEGPAGRPVTIARAGLQHLDQRPGEAMVFLEDFQSLDMTRWSQVGEAEIVAGKQTTGGHALRLSAGGAAVTHKLAEPIASGRLEVAFLDEGLRAAGQRWFVDLTFRGPAGLEPVQALLGWDEDSLAVLSRGGPALAVQRLARRVGWHHLVVRFGPKGTDLAVDGDELAHGNGPGGPLVEIRLATESIGGSAPPEGLATHLDDLRLVRFAEPNGRMEVDPSQDEARLVTGDQLFGSIRSADATRVLFELSGMATSLSWSDVAGLSFRRALAPQSSPLSGLWISLDWRAAAGHDPRDLDHLEGILTAVAADGSVTLEAPYIGTLTIPRDRLVALTASRRARRMILDPNPHHLGARRDEDLDPPQAEGGWLEVPFQLDEAPSAAATIVLDVVEVIGESGNAQFSDRVKAGELRTRVLLNGRPFDDLNRHVTSRNETPERIRLPVPAGVLRSGRNVLRFEQSGTKDDPAKRDNLGILGVALEFAAPGPVQD
jgi:hypothetical protein